MRCRLTKLVVFLLLGAIVNVAVAWGCALWSTMTQDSDLSKQRALALLEEREFLPRPGEYYSARTIEGIGLTVLELLFALIAGQETSEINQREGIYAVARFAGLPVRSLQAELRVALLGSAEPFFSGRLIGGIRIDNRVREQFSMRLWVYGTVRSCPTSAPTEALLPTRDIIEKFYHRRQDFG